MSAKVYEQYEQCPWVMVCSLLRMIMISVAWIQSSRLNSEQSQVTTSLSVMVCSFGPPEKKHVWSGRKWYVMGWYLLNLWAFCSIRVRKVIDSFKQTKDSYKHNILKFQVFQGNCLIYLPRKIKEKNKRNYTFWIHLGQINWVLILILIWSNLIKLVILIL